MWSGVRKSGWPMPRLMMSRPSAARRVARASTANAFSSPIRSNAAMVPSMRVSPDTTGRPGVSIAKRSAGRGDGDAVHSIIGGKANRQPRRSKTKRAPAEGPGLFRPAKPKRRLVVQERIAVAQDLAANVRVGIGTEHLAVLDHFVVRIGRDLAGLMLRTGLCDRR